jgi:hypothetical protein
MIRKHIRHIHHVIDDQALTVRLAITIGAVIALPLLGTAVRRIGETFDLGAYTLPLLVVAHVPAVVALIAVWSIGCDVCR